MKEKIKGFFTNNVGWKLVSLLLGLVIWAVITNTQDPVQTKVVNVPIRYLNEEQLLREENLIFMSGPDTVSISVQAQNSKLASVTSALFSCEADLMDHNGGDISSQRVHLTVTQTGGESIIHDWSYVRNNPNINVVMDERVTKEYPIQLLPEDSLTEGLILEGSVVFNPAVVTVTGPKTRFADVAAVKAAVNMKELSNEGSGNIQRLVELRLYDANNRVISDSSLKLSVTYSMMSATIDRLQSVTVIVSGTIGTPSEGYRYLSSAVSPQTLSVQGLKGAVADFTEVYIPAEDIDITGITGPKDYQVDVTKYFPDGVRLSDGDGIVTVHIDVEPVTSRRFEIRPGDILIYGEEEGYEYTLRSMEVDVMVQGFDEDLDVFRVSKLGPAVDVSGLEEGYHEVPIEINTVAGYRIENAEELVTFVTVKKVEIPSSESESETQGPTEPVTETEEPSGSEIPTESVTESEPASSTEEETTAPGSNT
ncbi:MAG: hypothetical protein J6Z38_04355 [Lachnospiraceae bacterium]|nr:hypothetical protein [Lachnospiraceae bacterium]